MDQKPKGKRAEPTAEELEFIHNRLIKLSDQEILDEMQDTEFPLRSLGFIKRRRREFDIAKKVLKIQLEKEIDPILVKRREDHFNYLAEIIETMIPEKTTTIRDTGSEYIITSANGKQTIFTHEQLATVVEPLLAEAAKQYGHTDVYEYLLPHLKAEIAETEGQELDAFIRENPIEFFKTLRLLVDKGVFKGTCPICKDW